ncbi:MAG: serine hydrolase [Saccharofermentanales bacterium]
MKKTNHGHQAQFLRERASADHRADSMNFGSISRSRSKIRQARKRRTRQIFVISVVLLVLATAGCIYAINRQKGEPSNLSNDFSRTVSGISSSAGASDVSQTASVNSAVSVSSAVNSAAVSSADRTASFVSLQAAITAYANDFNGRIGVYYINLINGETWGYHEKDPFVAASSIKLGINTLLYKRVSEGAFKFTDLLAYNNKPYPQGDMEPGTGVIIGQPNGTKYSVRRTSQLSITISDNCATNMVIRKLGGIDAVVPFLSEISSEVPYRKSITYVDYKGAVLSGRHRTSAKDLAMYAEHFYKLWKYYRADYQPLMEDLQNTVFHFGIQAKLPAAVKVAHKIGTNGDWKTENDAGIVFAKEPYVVCVTTENPSQTAGRDAVAEISLKIYNYINQVVK